MHASRLLAQVVLSTVDTIIYICPTDKIATVTHLVVCNTDTVARTYRVHHCLPNDAASVRNAQFYDARLANSVSVIDDTQRPMLQGETLRGRASAGSVVAVSVYGTESVA
jgi:hypothetical protein